MKKLLLILFLSNTTGIFAQIYKPIYYNDNWELTRKEYAEYFRYCYFDTINNIFIGDLKDYYGTGKLQMEGRIEMNGAKQDTFKFYFENGKILCKGAYLNDEKIGFWHYYYPNGTLKQIIEYKNQDFTVHEYLDSVGNVVLSNGNGNWSNSFYLPLTHDHFTIEGQFVNGLKDGKWICYIRNELFDRKRRIQYKEKFKKGEFVNGEWYWGGGSINRMNEEYKNKIAQEDHKFNQITRFKRVEFVSQTDYPFFKFLPKIDSIRLPVNRHAIFVGGEKAMHKFLLKNLRYPKLARKKSLEKTQLVQFIVEKDGSLTKIKSNPNSFDEEIARAGFHTEVSRVVSEMPKWEPAIRDSAAVAERISLWIKFKIVKEEMDYEIQQTIYDRRLKY